MDQLKLVLATNNPGKLAEFRALLKGKYEILSLDDVGLKIDIPEDFETLEENALQKARFISERTGMNVFADDTGLEVDALNGRPGVYSARYAGHLASSENNIAKLLVELKEKTNRKARFRTVVAAIIDQKKHLFEGICYGTILEKRAGKGGFGYDPIFMPEGYQKSFAEMNISDKNRISHRSKAIHKTAYFLHKIGH